MSEKYQNKSEQQQETNNKKKSNNNSDYPLTSGIPTEVKRSFIHVFQGKGGPPVLEESARHRPHQGWGLLDHRQPHVLYSYYFE